MTGPNGFTTVAGPASNILLLRAAQAGNINPKKFRRCGDSLKPFLLRGALDNLGALREARSVREQDRRNCKCDQTESSPDVLQCVPHAHSARAVTCSVRRYSTAWQRIGQTGSASPRIDRWSVAGFAAMGAFA
jgi:hypothetical protein